MRTFQPLRKVFLLFSISVTALTIVHPEETAATYPSIGNRGEPPSPSNIFRLGVQQAGRLEPRISTDFPDPSIIQDVSGLWIAFATNGQGKHIQVAITDNPLGQWQVLNYDAMPEKGWTSGRNVWAPDVRRLGDGSFIMYYTGEVPGMRKHCIGIARAIDILGPYLPDQAPWLCPLDKGGAIDASGFLDVFTGARYVVYKIDGNVMGRGGDCNNAIKPLMDTPLMVQEVGEDGATMMGEPVSIMSRLEEDGPLVEAPNLMQRADGVYVLFFSSHCFTDRGGYDVKYAYSTNIRGPYVRSDRQLIKTDDFELVGPGGMTSTTGVDILVFHGYCEEHVRCMYAVPYNTDQLEYIRD